MMYQLADLIKKIKAMLFNKMHHEEILETITELKINYTLIDKGSSDGIYKIILNKFSNRDQYYFPLWDHLMENSISIKAEYAWDRFNKLLGNREVILFFDLEDDPYMFKINDSANLVSIFENSYRMVFYLTNPTYDFLLAYNDHDYLIACGEMPNLKSVYSTS